VNANDQIVKQPACSRIYGYYYYGNPFSAERPQFATISAFFYVTKLCGECTCRCCYSAPQRQRTASGATALSLLRLLLLVCLLHGRVRRMFAVGRRTMRGPSAEYTEQLTFR